MRLVLAIFLLTFLPPFAVSAKVVSQETANTYYTACMGHNDPRLDPEGQMNLCSCAAANIMIKMTVEELAKMSPDVKNKTGRAIYDKMLIDVYGPCMNVPVQNALATQCMKDGKIKQFLLRDTSGMCQCMAARTGDFIESDGRKIIEDILEKFPKTTDIFPLLLDDHQVREKAYSHVYTCMHDQK